MDFRYADRYYLRRTTQREILTSVCVCMVRCVCAYVFDMDECGCSRCIEVHLSYAGWILPNLVQNSIFPISPINPIHFHLVCISCGSELSLFNRCNSVVLQCSLNNTHTQRPIELSSVVVHCTVGRIIPHWQRKSTIEFQWRQCAVEVMKTQNHVAFESIVFLSLYHMIYSVFTFNWAEREKKYKFLLCGTYSYAYVMVVGAVVGVEVVVVVDFRWYCCCHYLIIVICTNARLNISCALA